MLIEIVLLIAEVIMIGGLIGFEVCVFIRFISVVKLLINLSVQIVIQY